MTEELKDKIIQYIIASLTIIGVLLCSLACTIFAFSKGVLLGLFITGILLIAISYIMIVWLYK